MAVVAVGPLAIGMRYSVCESGRAVRLEFGSFTEGIHGVCCAFAFACALACANNANLDGRPFMCESVGDNGLDVDACDCIGDRPDDVFEASFDAGGIVCDLVFGVSPRSVASSSRAVWIARRTCDEVECDEVEDGLSVLGGGFTVEADEDDIVDAALRDFRDSVDGRRAG
jgi:hypothetical protein